MTVINRVLNERYRLLAPLGSGGMGSVWLAEDLLLGRRVALKELIKHQDQRDLDERRRRAMREARALARLKHPGIVQIHDVFVDHGDPWIVMEHIHARSLAELLDEGPLDERAAARIGLRVLNALTAAHHAEVLHRDVKPPNILVADDGKVSLVDFGVAQIAGVAPVTADKAVLGTIEFMAPERITGGVTGPAADLWSLGVTFFSALEGYSPFRRGGVDNAAATMWAIVNEGPPPLVTKGRLADAVTRLLHKQPAARLKAAELDRILRSVITPRPRPRPPRSEPLPPRAAAPRRPDLSRDPPAGAVRKLNGMSAGRAAALVAGLPTEELRDVLAAAEKSFAGQILLTLPGNRAAQVLAVSGARTAGGFLDAMAAQPRAAAPVLQMLSATIAGRALGHMTRDSAAAVLVAMPPGEAARILGPADLRTAAGIIAALPVSSATRLIEAMSVRRACGVLGYVPPVTVASLLRASTDGRTDQLLTGLSGPVRTQVNRHLG